MATTYAVTNTLPNKKNSELVPSNAKKMPILFATPIKRSTADMPVLVNSVSTSNPSITEAPTNAETCVTNKKNNVKASMNPSLLDTIVTLRPLPSLPY